MLRTAIAMLRTAITKLQTPIAILQTPLAMLQTPTTVCPVLKKAYTPGALFLIFPTLGRLIRDSIYSLFGLC